MNFLTHADYKNRHETLSSSLASSDGITILSSSSSLSSESYTTDSASMSKGTVSIKEEGSFQTMECDNTATETVASSNWSQAGSYLNSIDQECFLLRILKFCSFCFGRPIPGLDSLRRKDCFVDIDPSLARLERESEYTTFDTYRQTLEAIDEHATTPNRVQFEAQAMKHHKPNIFDPLAVCKRYRSNHDGAPSITPCTFTPVAFDSRASFMGRMSTTTNHRRADISVGFFTLSTLEAIHSYDPDESEDMVTPRSNQSEQSETGNKSAYKTPAARPRIDSEIFRSAIGEVTCEKRGANSDDDISPIESLCGFSLLMNAEGRRSELSIQSKSPLGDAIQKRLVYDSYVHQNNASDETHLPKDLAAPTEARNKPNFPEVGIKLIDSIQSLISRPPTKAVKHGSPNEATKPTVSRPHLITREGTTGTSSSRQQLFLQKSVSFIKALRKSGRAGKCLVQGWVAFRQDVSWREVALCTRRSDFRYVVLLDDMPVVHIFSSKPKQKRGAPKPNVIENCISLDLSKDVEVGISLACPELGQEVYMVELESSQFICSLLPIAMKSNLFLDKHKSRLAKGDVLESVFQKSKPKEGLGFQKVEPSAKAKVTFQDNGNTPCPKTSNQTHAAIEQNDAARHLLFVLSAAITFPPPRQT